VAAYTLSIPGVTISGELGRGARGFDYRARSGEQTCLLRVAAETTPEEREPTFRAFRTEAIALARARHFAIPAVFELGDVDGRPYVVMELPEGQTLAEKLRWGPLPELEIVRLAVCVLGALLEVHRRGLVHGSLSPARLVFIGGTSDLRIGGFGEWSPGAEPAGAPDARSDFAALGRVLYECATGRVPYAGLTADPRGELTELPELSGGDAPLTSPALSRLIALLLRFETTEQPPDVLPILRQLERLDSHAPAHPIRERPAHASGDASSLEEVPFVGRREQLETLRQAWKDAVGGVARMVHVSGAPGSGKTRLVRTFLDETRGQRRLVLEARCTPGDARPLAALADLLGAHARNVDQVRPGEAPELRSALRDAGRDLAPFVRRLSPELARLYEGTAELGAPHEVQALFAEGVAESLLRLLASGPAIVWIDDLQWIDPSSRAVLTRVVDRARGSRVLFVVTSRADEQSTAEVDQFFRPIRNLRPRASPIGALDGDQVQRLLEAYLGTPGLPAEIVGPLVSLGDGTPLCMLELLHAIAGEGLLVPSRGRWRLDREGLERMQFPTRMREILARRVAELSANTRRVMAAAAVLGLVVDEELLGAITPDLDTAAALREAREARVLVRTGARESRFVHETVREALIGRLDATELRAYHQRIAERLDAEGGDDLGAVCRLAAEYAAGDWERAPDRVFATNYEAGRRTFSSFDDDRALSFLTVAERAAARAGIDPDAEFHQTLGEVYLKRGTLARARDHFDAALARTRVALSRGVLHSRRAWILYNMGDAPGAWRALEESFAALDHAMPSGKAIAVASSVARWPLLRRELGRPAPTGLLTHTERQRVETLCAAHYQAARLALETGEPGRFLAHVLESIDQAERLGPSRALVRSLLLYALAKVVVGARASGLADIRTAAAMAESIRDPVVSAYCLQIRSVVMAWAGDIDAALEASRELLVERGHWLELGEYCVLCWNQSLILGVRGDAAAAWEWIARAIAKVRHEPNSGEIAPIVELAARAALMTLGRDAELPRHFEGLTRTPPEPWTMLRPQQRLAVGSRVRVFTEVGELGTAFEALVREVRGSVADPARAHLALAEFYVQVAHARVHQCLRAPESERARLREELAQSAREVRAVARVPLLAAHRWVIDGYAALFERSFARASRCFARAEELGQREKAPWVLFAVARGRAHLHRAHGRSEPALVQAMIAATIAQTRGYAYRLRWIQEEFPGLEAAGSGDTARTARDGAAGRQLEALLQIGRASPSDLNLTEQARRVLDELVEVLHAERGALWLSPETGGSLAFIAARDGGRRDTAPPPEAVQRLVHRAFESGATVFERPEGPSTDTRPAPVVVASPFVLRERVIGAVCLETSRSLSADEARFLDDLAGQAAITLELTRVLRARAEELRERKVLEDGLRQAQKMEAIGRLAGAIAHDFNNVLAIITTTLDLLQRRDGGRELRDIRDASERGAALTRQLLTFSRRQPIAPKLVHLNGVLASCLPMIQRLLPDSIALDTRLDSVLDTVLADPIRVEQVLLNLAANARDAMPEGGTLRVVTADERAAIDESRSDALVDCVVLSVEDTGEGMDPDVLRQVFEPFFTTKAQGTGLGLATVYGIVRQLGGRIVVDSARGRGTTFRILFPRAPAGLAAAGIVRENDKPREAEPMHSRVARRPETILLVDDERLILTALERGLIREGYRVVAALTAEEALDLVQREGTTIDFVITDVLMPGMNGPQLVEALERMGVSAPHLYISGFTDKAFVTQRVDEASLLVKPFTIAMLTERIRTALRRDVDRTAPGP
jgi:signal transduction histidine kinase/ActR/RegA family two-component response regulator/tetratricopeptide (TPR) repeat protein